MSVAGLVGGGGVAFLPPDVPGRSRWRFPPPPTITGKTYTFYDQPGGFCGPHQLVGSLLENVAKQGLDHAMRSLPSSEWALPLGFGGPMQGQTHLVVRQHSGKDGLDYHVFLRRADGSEARLGVFDKKGYKTPRVKLGSLELGARFAPNGGLAELELKWTSPQGDVTTYKFKFRCDLDLGHQASGPLDQRTALLNQGAPQRARLEAEAWMERAMLRHGDIWPALLDLLGSVRPDAQGVFRNHGSPALAALTDPLNLIAKHDRQAVMELRELQDHGTRAGLERWFRRRLGQLVREGRVQPAQLANVFGLNHGVPGVPKKPWPQPAPPRPGPRLSLDGLSHALRAADPHAWVSHRVSHVNGGLRLEMQKPLTLAQVRTALFEALERQGVMLPDLHVVVLGPNTFEVRWAQNPPRGSR